MFDRNESKNVELTPELAALERQLVGLDIAPLHVDRDRLMFEAGRAAGRAEQVAVATLRVARAPRWVWPSAAAILAAACLVLGAMLVWRDDAALVARQEVKPQAVDAPGIEAPSPAELREVERLASRADGTTWLIRPAGGYLEQRYLALTRGLGELRSEGGSDMTLPPSDTAQPTTARELLRELVPQRITPAHSSS